MPVFTNAASRILSLVFLTLIVAGQGWTGLLVLVLPLAALYAVFPVHGLQVFRLARKLRWFFLSIIILYFWFFPGTPIFSSLSGFSPTVEGVDQAALRITSLLVVISYSGFLLLLTPVNELVSGIQLLLTPMKTIGVDTQRVALRLGMVLTIVSEMSTQQLLPKENKKFTGISGFSDRAVSMIESALEHAEAYELDEAGTKDNDQGPGIFDILIPLFLFIWLFSRSL